MRYGLACRASGSHLNPHTPLLLSLPPCPFLTEPNYHTATVGGTSYSSGNKQHLTEQQDTTYNSILGQIGHNKCNSWRLNGGAYCIEKYLDVTREFLYCTRKKWDVSVDIFPSVLFLKGQSHGHSVQQNPEVKMRVRQSHRSDDKSFIFYPEQS